MPEFPIPSARILLVSQIQGGDCPPLPPCPVRLWRLASYYAAVLSLSPFVCPIWSQNTPISAEKPKIGVNVLRGRSNQLAYQFLSKRSNVES